MKCNKCKIDLYCTKLDCNCKVCCVCYKKMDISKCENCNLEYCKDHTNIYNTDKCNMSEHNEFHGIVSLYYDESSPKFDHDRCYKCKKLLTGPVHNNYHIYKLIPLSNNTYLDELGVYDKLLEREESDGRTFIYKGWYYDNKNLCTYAADMLSGIIYDSISVEWYTYKYGNINVLKKYMENANRINEELKLVIEKRNAEY